MTLEGRILTVECPCAGTPHEVDTVTFRSVLPLAAGIEGMAAIGASSEKYGADISGLHMAEFLFPVYLRHCIDSWTFVNGLGKDGEPLPLPLEDGDAILPFDMKYRIADAADDLFGEEITRPLLRRIARSSGNGQTAQSTSPKRSTARSRQPRSAPSSRSTSAGTTP